MTVTITITDREDTNRFAFRFQEGNLIRHLPFFGKTAKKMRTIIDMMMDIPAAPEGVVIPVDPAVPLEAPEAPGKAR